MINITISVPNLLVGTETKDEVEEEEGDLWWDNQEINLINNQMYRQLNELLP